ncbi:MAG TPA: hypothetical protein VNN79_03120 [Actinomycetota bacterium]|nr:hypothetical protein [Actinomycetota bacterium]
MTVRRTPIRALVVLVLLAAACSRAGASGPPASHAVPSVEPTHAFRSVVPSLSTVPTPCPSPSKSGSGIEVDYFDSPGGGCIAADQLRQFRCGDTVDPVIEAGGVRFLGGRFAMLAPGLPGGVGLIGHGAGEDLFIQPGDRPTLYVRTDDGRIFRWLLVLDGTADPHALFVGDSITVGSRAAIVRALPGWTASFHAEVGRNTDQGIEAARTVHDIGSLDAVVVELGTNESTPDGFPDRIAQMLSIVRDARLVVWVTVHRDDLSFVDELNTDIDAGLEGLPNGAVADWASVVRPEDLVSDGVHPDDQGKQLMGSLLADVLTRWHDAATGFGATACASSLG